VQIERETIGFKDHINLLLELASGIADSNLLVGGFIRNNYDLGVDIARTKDVNPNPMGSRL